MTPGGIHEAPLLEVGVPHGVWCKKRAIEEDEPQGNRQYRLTA